MATTLPPPGAQRPRDHRAIALRFLDHAQQELDKGNRLQASEKAWGAVAHQLKAMAIERRWAHGSHYLYFRMAEYLTQEYRLDSNFYNGVAGINNAHRNFYENNHGVVGIQANIDQAKELVALIEELRHRQPGSYRIGTVDERNAVEDLTGWQFDVQHERADGFVKLPTPPKLPGRRRRNEHFPWRNTFPNDPDNPPQQSGGTGGGGGRRPPPSSPPGGAPVAQLAPTTAPAKPTAAAGLPVALLDQGVNVAAVDFLENPKPPRNNILMGRSSGAPPPQAQGGGRPKRAAGQRRLPSGRRDRGR